MDHQDALALLAPAIALTTDSPVWIDLGAGSGTFTRALAELLGQNGTVHAVEREAKAVRSLRLLAEKAARDGRSARILVVHADFAGAATLPSANGLLFANSLHFVGYDQQPSLLARLSATLQPRSSVVLIEYDRRSANPWVPYPIDRERLERMATDAGLGAPRVVATAPSLYGAELYCAVMAARA